jgi:peptidoglycan/xylan/chitin deacetylase (PgdA/CDA1 family)
MDLNLEEIGSIIEYGDNFVIGAHFPMFGIDSIDLITRNFIQSYIEEFNILVKNHSPEDKNYKSELSIDYEVYYFSTSIVSIEFNIFEFMSYYPNPSLTTSTLTYDLKNKEIINLEEIINDIPVVVVSQETTEPISKDVILMNPNIEMVSSERNIDPDKPMIALTFDDGPHKNTTIPILDTLKLYNGVGTFFILGNRVKNNENLLKRMISEENEIGNHSFSHKQLTTISSSEVKSQIDKTQKAVLEVTGSKPKVMRPTYGSYNSKLKSQIDMPMILWSIDTLDWESRDPVKIATHVLDNVEDGDIILMHDIYESTVDAVKILVPELISRGYQLVTVSELYELKGEALQVGNIYSKLYR